jgi:hypothetical protein
MSSQVGDSWDEDGKNIFHLRFFNAGGCCVLFFEGEYQNTRKSILSATRKKKTLAVQ